jgi:hypothetical protein
VRGAAALLALVLLAGGCGGGGESGGTDAKIDLELTLWPSGVDGDSVTWQLECEPTGGDHPDPAGACAALTSVPDPFGPVAPPARCAEIPESGPEVAVLDGTFRGRKVRSTFERSSACVTPRWDRIAPVFPAGF